ncbi:hypothetical protein V8C26DRAFT_65351 [Trichoderma gracile]
MQTMSARVQQHPNKTSSLCSQYTETCCFRVVRVCAFFPVEPIHCRLLSQVATCRQSQSPPVLIFALSGIPQLYSSCRHAYRYAPHGADTLLYGRHAPAPALRAPSLAQSYAWSPSLHKDVYLLVRACRASRTFATTQFVLMFLFREPIIACLSASKAADFPA